MILQKQLWSIRFHKGEIFDHLKKLSSQNEQCLNINKNIALYLNLKLVSLK
jgi:hypothetical protein